MLAESELRDFERASAAGSNSAAAGRRNGNDIAVLS
jgi:hypothetical protein